MLSFATDISLDELYDLCEANQGVCIPAHIDRPSYSVISNLGMIPEHMSFTTIEVSKYADLSEYQEKYNKLRVIQSSDAHELGHIGSCEVTLDVQERTIQSFIESLKSKL